ncbi:MAG: glycosyltransferase family 2 protein [Parachlamydiales bacterium]|jgi:glycosyltransferase involved in cell wall biosynthesis
MISVVILTKNSSETIKDCLLALNGLDEIIIIDTGSTDNTLSLVKNYENTKIYNLDFTGFGELRNLGASNAKNDWILAIDSDEILTDALKKEILNETFDPEYVYGFFFNNYYNNKLIKCCGWYPEKHIRLYNKTKTHFSNSLVHEKLIEDNFKKKYFINPIKHFPYRKIDDFLQKMSKYSTLFASQNKTKKSSLTKAIIHSFFAFFKSYIIKKGFLAKQEGFIISVYNANTAFYKYLKLQETNSKEK